MESIALLGSALGTAFASGINLYATILTLGLGLRFDLFELPEQLAGLEIFSNLYIIIVAAALYIIEFIADKIPWIDTAWDFLHTFIRPIGAAYIGLKVFGTLEPTHEVILALLMGGVGLASHSTKSSVRLATNQSPEPVSNSILSTIEDLASVVVTYLAIKYWYISFTIVIIFILCLIVFGPILVRLLKMHFYGLYSLIINRNVFHVQQLPTNIRSYFDQHGVSDESKIFVSFSGSGLSVGKYRRCLLLELEDKLIFVVKKWRKYNLVDFNLSDTTTISKRGMLYSRITKNINDRKVVFSIPIRTRKSYLDHTQNR